MILIILIVVINILVWGALVGRLLNKFGWVIALGVVLLLLLLAVVVTISNRNKEIPVTDELKNLVEESKKQNSNDVYSQSETVIKKDATENDVGDLVKNPTKMHTEEEIKTTKSVTEPSKLNSMIELEVEKNEKLTSEARSNNEDFVTPNLMSKSPKTVLSQPIFPIKEPTVMNDELVLDESRKDNLVKIDIMRVDGLRDTIVAGRSEPNSRVEALVDGNVIGSTQADNEGEFVIMGTLGDTAVSQTLMVRSSTAPSIEKKAEEDSIMNRTAEKNNNEQKEKNNYLEWSLSDDIFVILPSLTDEKNKNANLNTVPMIVQSSSDEIKIIQNVEQSLVTGITIDSISYSNLGEAILIGRGNPNNKALIYLDNTLVSSSNVGALGGWSAELLGISPGLYKLRIDEVNEIGEVQSRIATPFKKESKDFLMNMVSGSITVQTGNSLWRIARRIFGQGIRYIEIYEKNNDLIKDPNLIYPGQVFSIPTENYNS